MKHIKRRKFVKSTSALVMGAPISLAVLQSCNANAKKEAAKVVEEVKEEVKPLFFKLSLAQWSYHRALFDNKMTTLDFAAKAKELNFDGIEYVNAFFKDKAEDFGYLDQLNQLAKDNDVYQNLIMIDREGNLGSTNDAERTKAIENHYKWVNAAKYLGCGSIRVNAAGEGTAEEVAAAAVDGLGRLSEYAAKENINVIVENHGSYSSNGKWLASVLGQVGLPNCGSLPDFGNFCITRDKDYNCLEEYDRYLGMEELMPFAKAVSAKSHDFDANGNEIHSDYTKMLTIVKNSGFKGYINVEYEGRTLSEEEGVIKTRDLLLKVGKTLS